MRPEMVYSYPLWAVGSAIAGGAVLAAVLLELVVGRFVSARVRRDHNDLTAAIFAITGVTYAVLLSFVAMLAWEGYNAARAATGHEAAILLDVERTASGLPDPARLAVHGTLVGYAEAVITREWPAQAEGQPSSAGAADLDQTDRLVFDFKPADLGQGNIQASLLASLDRLRQARDERRLAAETRIPDIVWFVVIMGGAITMAFSSCLGTSSLAFHLVLASLLSLSGALILILIVALSHPFRGEFRVTAAPFEAALTSMSRP